MPLRISALYLFIFSLFYIALTLNVIRNRWKHRVNMGDGAKLPMTQAVRAHGNFAEYVPYGMLLVAVLEFCGRSGTVLHNVAGLLLLGRVAHAYGLLSVLGPSKGRSIGMVSTMLSILIGAFSLLGIFLGKW